MRDQEIRFCLTAIDNKYPDRLVETIDLVSAKNKTAGCILAISIGKKNLLKPEKPADKPADTTAENPSDKPAVKPAPKPAAKAAGKSATPSPAKVRLPASP
jgi:hypothetical protein